MKRVRKNNSFPPVELVDDENVCSTSEIKLKRNTSSCEECDKHSDKHSDSDEEDSEEIVDTDSVILSEDKSSDSRLLRRLSQFVENPEKILLQILDEAKRLTHFQALPDWLKDNDFLHSWHRPPMPSFTACFKSIFSIHSETGNIWTHMIGCLMFIFLAFSFGFWAPQDMIWQEKLVIQIFFISVILALAFSFLYHTLSCHSPEVGRLFCKLDYCGISLLIAGSFVPWLYYAFYCRLLPKITYLIFISALALTCILLSFWDKLATPSYRPLRTFMFMAFGLSGVIPVTHYLISNGIQGFFQASVGWLILMGLLYILGAIIYVGRVPERFFPGKCDIWFQSHQIFHILVVSAAFVHYHGLSNIALHRISFGDCHAVVK